MFFLVDKFLQLERTLTELERRWYEVRCECDELLGVIPDGILCGPVPTSENPEKVIDWATRAVLELRNRPVYHVGAALGLGQGGSQDAAAVLPCRA